MLWKYLHHLIRESKQSSTPGDPYSFMLPDQFCNLGIHVMETGRLQSVPNKQWILRRLLKPKSDKDRQTDRQTVGLRFSWESVLNQICISPWDSERVSYVEKIT